MQQHGSAGRLCKRCKVPGPQASLIVFIETTALDTVHVYHLVRFQMSSFPITSLSAATQNTVSPEQNALPGPVPTQSVRLPRDWLLGGKKSLRNCLSQIPKFWSALHQLGAAARQRCSVSTWLGITATFVIGGLGLRYAYQQQMLASQSMKLAEWTARKDFWEVCQEQAKNITLNFGCESVLRDPFPEPPYVDIKIGRRDEVRLQRDNERLYGHTADKALQCFGAVYFGDRLTLHHRMSAVENSSAIDPQNPLASLNCGLVTFTLDRLIVQSPSELIVWEPFDKCFHGAVWPRHPVSLESLTVSQFSVPGNSYGTNDSRRGSAF